MIFNDIIIPKEIIDAARKGRLVVFAGAGVSMGKPTGFPSFIELAKKIEKGVEGGVAVMKLNFITKNRVFSWLRTTAGKLSLTLFFVSVILLIGSSLLSKSNLSTDWMQFWNNILSGLAINLFGIIVTISFVQFF